MRRPTTAPTALKAGTLVLSGALALTGCSSGTDSVGEQMAEELIESGVDGGVEVEIDDDSMSMTDEEGGGFSATWQMERPDEALVEAYVAEWESVGFTRGGFVDMSTDGTRVWTYQMTSPELEVAVSATIADGNDAEDSLVSISGTYVE